MTILPLTYLGGIEWFRRLTGGGCVIDVGENWVKQTARNRAEIATAGGVTALTVPVHGYGAKIASRDVRIDSSRRWQHNHWQSIVSAYRAAPYFDHYRERFEPLFCEPRGGGAPRFEFLIDLNLRALEIVCAALGLNARFEISDTYIVAAPDDIDLRGKKALRRNAGAGVGGMVPGASASAAPDEYIQVFHDRMRFEPGLSIIDLLFCEGPSARRYL